MTDSLTFRRRRAIFLLNTKLGSKPGLLGRSEVARQLRENARELGVPGPLADVIDLICQLDKPFFCDPITGLVFLVDSDRDDLDKQQVHCEDKVLGGEGDVTEPNIGHGSLSSGENLRGLNDSASGGTT